MSPTDGAPTPNGASQSTTISVPIALHDPSPLRAGRLQAASKAIPTRVIERNFVPNPFHREFAQLALGRSEPFSFELLGVVREGTLLVASA